eukprot:g5868.t1
MLSSDTLDLEASMKNERKVMHEQGADICNNVCNKIREVWETLGNRQFAMVKKLVEALLSLADSKHEKTKALTTDMYLSLFLEELKHSNNFVQIRVVTITAVKLIKSKANALRQAVGDFFDIRVRQKFQSDPLLNTSANLNFLSEIKIINDEKRESFIPSAGNSFDGPKYGYVYKKDQKGLGYYLE